MGFILILVILMGTVMYIIEGAEHNYELNDENKFSSIPASIYWAVVTVTTVGYGDITPSTILGKFLSSALMIIGYAIITVPTGIVTVEFADQKRKQKLRANIVKQTMKRMRCFVKTVGSQCRIPHRPRPHGFKGKRRLLHQR